MPRRIVILSLARSGTSLLTSTQDTHPDILCHGEIFHPTPTWPLNSTLAKLSLDEMKAAQQQPDFLTRVFDQDRPVVGFKMWRSQNPQVCAEVLADRFVRKIIYQRENGLAQFASGYLGRQTGVWDMVSKANARLTDVAKLRFVPTAFDQFLANRDHEFAQYHDGARGSVLNLTYREIVAHGFDRPLTFLGVLPMQLHPQKRQLHSIDILSRFIEQDHTPIRAHLDRIGHPEWHSE